MLKKGVLISRKWSSYLEDYKVNFNKQPWRFYNTLKFFIFILNFYLQIFLKKLLTLCGQKLFEEYFYQFLQSFIEYYVRNKKLFKWKVQ